MEVEVWLEFYTALWTDIRNYMGDDRACVEPDFKDYMGQFQRTTQNDIFENNFM